LTKLQQVLDGARERLLSEYPDKQELTAQLLDEITAMLREDFEAVSRKKQRLAMVFDCIAGILEKMQQQQVKKKYATQMLEVFLDREIAGYLSGWLGEQAGLYVGAVKGAGAELHTSQWSDESSTHWNRAIQRFRL